MLPRCLASPASLNFPAHQHGACTQQVAAVTKARFWIALLPSPPLASHPSGFPCTSIPGLHRAGSNFRKGRIFSCLASPAAVADARFSGALLAQPLRNSVQIIAGPAPCRRQLPRRRDFRLPRCLGSPASLNFRAHRHGACTEQVAAATKARFWIALLPSPFTAIAGPIWNRPLTNFN